MKRPGEADRELWRRVQATVRPLGVRPTVSLQPALWRMPSDILTPTPPQRGPLEGIEPRRERRLERGRDALDARLDLHGLGHDQARAALHAFLRRAHSHGLAAVLVITGKGVGGEGVLRRAMPGWLAEPSVRELVAGVSPAGRRHGGEGAFYVALRRRPRGHL